MKAVAFINAASCISPQDTFGATALPAVARTFEGKKFIALEPDYKTHLNIPSARRMSRLIKMSVCAALVCMKDAGLRTPDAIIAGTGLGCMEDSEKFLASLLDNNEQTLSPTSFIFSTHNTVAAQVALLVQCHNYNFTHTHRGLSFENSLLDSILFLNEHPGANVLAGAADEVTETSFKILSRLEAIKKSGDALEEDQLSGTGFGEGAAFFALSNSPANGSLARLAAVNVFSHPEDEKEISERVADFVQTHNVSSRDLILMGINGNEEGDKIYSNLRKQFFNSNPAGSYKHLCGEYHTCTAFACWLAAMMIHTQTTPGYIMTHGIPPEHIERVLIVNHYKSREFSLMLLEKC